MRMIAMWLSQHAYSDEKYRQYAQRKLSANFQHDETEMNTFIREYIDNVLPYMDEITMGNADRFLSHDMTNHRLVLHMRFEKVLRELSVGERGQLFSLLYEVYETMSVERDNLPDDLGTRYFAADDMTKYRQQKEFMLTSVRERTKGRSRRHRTKGRTAAAKSSSSESDGLAGMFASLMGSAAGSGAGPAGNVMGLLGSMMQNPQKLAEIGQSLEHSQLGQMAKQFMEDGKINEMFGSAPGEPINPATMMQQMFSPEGQTRMMGMMQTIAQQLDQKVQSGELNTAALQQDVMEVMRQASDRSGSRPRDQGAAAAAAPAHPDPGHDA